MNEFGDRINFRQLLERHRQIRIPMIQRDYAQGRSTEEEIREEFLTALYDALSRPPGYESLPLNLDFIYGSVERDKETRFLPLDGQQRLTTLFLLHWYLAWKDGYQDEFRQMFQLQEHSRFSYEVRSSSTEFFDELVKFVPDSSPDNVSSLKQMVTNQPWYFRYWRLDPTIQSALTMLDAIHDRFRETEGCFSRLVDTERPPITFQLLDLENFGLSDDLYIKMNGRGIPLTAFETFKARYAQVLKDQFAGKTRTVGDQSFSVAEFFARRMDTEWADFFWSLRDKQTSLYDVAVMNLFRAVALVSRDPESDSYPTDISLLRDGRLRSTFSVFSKNGWLDRNLSETLFLLLETWSKEGTDFATQLPDTKYFDEVTLFTKAVREPTNLSYVEIVQLVAYIVFLREHGDALDSDAFQEWMRVVFNLSVNTLYDRPDDLKRSIAGIFELESKCGNILEYFATTEKPTTGFSEQQVLEEKLKAELIRVDSGWRTLIDQAERHGYFKGQIEFLLDFCGASEKWRNSEGVDWGADAHVSLQGNFQDYLCKANLMFEDHGLSDLGRYRWERALLSIGHYLLPSGGQNYSFLVNPSTAQASWKRLLRGTGAEVPEARKLLHQLWDILEVNGDFGDQLDAIISGATSLEQWRQALVDTPEAIEYCEKRVVRWISKDVVYLLKRRQMNGAHAELFTFCLFHNRFSNMNPGGGLEPLEVLRYEFMNGTEMEPGIRFEWSHDGHSVYFDFERSGDGYIIFVNRDSLGRLPDLNSILCDEAGFQESEEKWQRVISPTDIETSLRELADALATTSSRGATHA